MLSDCRRSPWRKSQSTQSCMEPSRRRSSPQTRRLRWLPLRSKVWLGVFCRGNGSGLRAPVRATNPICVEMCGAAASAIANMTAAALEAALNGIAKALMLAASFRVDSFSASFSITSKVIQCWWKRGLMTQRQGTGCMRHACISATNDDAGSGHSGIGRL